MLILALKMVSVKFPVIQTPELIKKKKGVADFAPHPFPKKLDIVHDHKLSIVMSNANFMYMYKYKDSFYTSATSSKNMLRKKLMTVLVI